jgi:hypothetical protein
MRSRDAGVLAVKEAEEDVDDEGTFTLITQTGSNGE